MFSDRQLKALKPGDAPYRIYEQGSIPGFGIQVTPKGSKTFFLHFTFKDKRRFMSLGRYPAVTLQDARERAQAARAELDRGNDPQGRSGGTENARVRTGTVQDACDLYIEDMQARGKSSWVEVKRSLDNDVVPHIGHLLARDVRPRHFQKVLAAVLDRGVEVEHAKVRSRCHAAMQFALTYDYDPRAIIKRVRFGMDFNPVAAVPTDKAVAGRTLDRALTFSDINLVWHGPWLPYPKRALRLLLALGGLRPVEVLGMRVSEINREDMTFTVPPERFKGRRYHVVPLTKLSLAIIDEQLADMATWEIESDLVFQSAEHDEFYAPNTLSQYLLRAWRDKNHWPAGLGKFTPYDLRRTVKTRMGEIGIEKTIRDRLQGHAMHDVSSKHYDRWDYLPEKRAAMERWCDRLAAALIR